MIYLDNAATTYPKPEAVYKAMDKANRELAVNAGRGSYRKAQEASKLIAETKTLLRQLIHADSNVGVVFSPSITIAMNQIINGLEFIKNETVYVSPYEHNAVARPLHKLSKDKGIQIKKIPIDIESLEIDIDKLRYEFAKDKPSAVFCTHVSNVTGYILPVEEIFEEAKKYDAITVLDSAQSLGLIDIDVRQFNVDFIAFTGHKTLYGPFGIGGFFNVTNENLNEFIVGGTGSDSLNLDMPEGIEARYESASNNIVAIAGLYSALKNVNIAEYYKKEKELTDYLIDKLSETEGINLYLPLNRSKHIGIVSFSHGEYSSEDVGAILDEDFEIAVRTGYHCAPFIHDYLKDKQSLGTVRIGLGKFNNKEEIDIFVECLSELD